jgi:hypothetical protein
MGQAEIKALDVNRFNLAKKKRTYFFPAAVL